MQSLFMIFSVEICLTKFESGSPYTQTQLFHQYLLLSAFWIFIALSLHCFAFITLISLCSPFLILDNDSMIRMSRKSFYFSGFGLGFGERVDCNMSLIKCYINISYYILCYHEKI